MNALSVSLKLVWFQMVFFSYPNAQIKIGLILIGVSFLS